MNKKKILERIESRLSAKGCTKDTINTYFNISSQFLDTVKNDPPKLDDLDNFLASLRKKNYKPNYLRFNYYIISRIYKTMGWEELDGPPKLDEETVSRKMFSEKEIESLIKGVRKAGTKQEKAFLATSTIWGLRRSEITRIRPEDIEDSTIEIHTRKGGLIRKHTIPNEIKPYISDYDWKDEMSLSRATILFDIILYRAGFDLHEYNGYSWHAIRRRCVTSLAERGIPELKIHHFFRWKSGKSMVYTYARFSDKEVENEIYKNHPFIGLWK